MTSILPISDDDTPSPGDRETRNDFTSVSLWLTFRNPRVQRSYEKYREQDVSIITSSIYIAIYTLAYIYGMFVVGRYFTEHPSFYFPMFFVGVRILLLVPIWMMFLSLPFFPSLQKYRMFHHATLWGNIFIVGNSILGTTTSLSIYNDFAGNIALLSRVLVGKCTDDNYFSQYICNPEHESSALPQESTVGLIVSLVMLQVIYKCHNWPAVLFAWVITTFFLILSVVISEAHNSTLIPVVGAAMIIVLYDYERHTMQTYTSFVTNEKSVRQSLQVENEKHLADMHAAELRSLFGNVAHDLKTPLQAFVLSLESLIKLLHHPIAISPESVSYTNSQSDDAFSTVKSLQDTCQFMYMTINRAIDFNKASVGIPLAPAQETLHLLNTLHWAIDVVNRTQPRIPIVLEPLPKDVCSDIITDKQWLIENMLCLASNAVKYTSSGSVSVRAYISKSSQYGGSSNCPMLCVEVEDTGIGVPAAMRGSLFQPFKSMQRMAGGTGLGLYSMLKRVESLGGKCGLRDRYDGASGSCFWFSIPYRPDEVSASLRETVALSNISSGSERVSVPDKSSYTLPSEEDSNSSNVPSILFVEDSLMVQKTTSRALKGSGYTVELAENGAIALDMMKQRVYSLVLMDLQMPVMDGLEAVRRLRQWETSCHRSASQLVIGVSANSDVQTQQEALGVGMNGFISKPFTVKNLQEYCQNHNFMTSNNV